ncbi:hypothetical protein [Kitasatospora indigofera]|uniref:hypothetical protein n=1 Tax=Kitasatospora indigofera TaxID=67307 RepID=UPI0036CE3561
MTASVPLEGLVKGDLLGKGGQGTVWAVPGRRINGEWPVAFKEYAPELRRELNGPALDALVDFVPAQPAPVGRWLCERTAWPAAVVAGQDGARRGFLMRLVPEDFFIDPDATGRKLAGFEFLLNHDAFLRRMEITVTDRQRLLLLLDLARTLERLHGLAIVVGDLSPKNVLFRLGAEPGCFLIDCDAMRLAGRDALAQRDTPGWELPPGEAPATRGGDAHKFGLLAVRLFDQSQDGRDVGALARASAELGALAEAGLRADPGGRPAPGAWVEPLRRAVRAAVTPASKPAGPKPPPSPAAPKPAAPSPAAPKPAPNPPYQVPNPRPTPPVQLTPPVHRPPSPVPPGRGRARKARRRLAGLLLVAALGYGATQLVGTGPDGAGSHGSATRSQSAAGGTEAPGAGGPGGSGDDQAGARAAAVALDGLLGRNDGTRGEVSSAVNAVSSCSGRSGVLAAAATLRKAAADRAALVGRIDGVDLSRLPAGQALATALRDSWNASARADLAFARWADQAASGGCDGGAMEQTSDWDEGLSASQAATRAKQEFVRAWNPVAQSFGLSARVADAI